jgi:hypothetical protein
MFIIMRWQVVKGLLVLFAIMWPFSAHAHDKGAEKLPPPPVTFRIIAPSAQGPWLLRIDNESSEPMRIAADIRLLTFEVRAPSKRSPRRSYAGGWVKRASVCNGPKTFGLEKSFPAKRELVLEPGHSYTEEFDPRLICFGKDADLLVPGTRVKAYFGWKPKSKWSRRMESAPFVADSARRPRRFRPLRRLAAPSMVLSHAPPVVYGSDIRGRSETDAASPKASDPKGAAKASKNSSTAEGASKFRPRAIPDRRRKRLPKDELAARMTLTTSHYADGRRPTDVQLSVEAHNTGERPLFVALRSRMLSFRVEGPNGTVKCTRTSSGHQVPRDLFKTLHHGKHVHMRVLLGEVCPPGTFDRPGLYIATPTLHADANGKQYGLIAKTGRITTVDPGKPGGTHVKADDATLIRLRSGRRGYYKQRPTQIPTRVLP